MPLVVPGINSKSDGQQSDWMNKLVGKKIADTTDSTNFAKKDLPKEHRILEPGSMATMDFKQDRLNVHLGEDGTVQRVTHG